MKLIKAIFRMYWQWVADCAQSDIYDLEEYLSFLDGWEYTHASKQLNQARKELAHAEKKIGEWS